MFAHFTGQNRLAKYLKRCSQQQGILPKWPGDNPLAMRYEVKRVWY